MDSKVIILIALASIASGCADTGGGTGISIKELNVEPSQISADSTAVVNFEAVNNGNLAGEVNTGSNGTEIMTNYCSDIFKIEDFRSSATKPSSNENQYKLETGDRLRLTWMLDQNKPGEIPLQGYPCDLKFQLPFNYSVKAYKQIQVKQDREADGSPNLGSDISEGPLSIDMEVIGSTSNQRDTVLKRDNASIYLTAHNTDDEDSSFRGLIKIQNISISSSGKIQVNKDCGEKGSVDLASGKEKIYRCQIKHDEFDTPSIRGEVEAEINYTFVKDLGSKSIQVKYNG
ncbi:hypothetical protein [Candidatus Nanohalobium constans]|uniref:Uncharacterized protein n=1 Tax=Candidatus Nanohalobium constans TaxID=2565781 RepID=A0A5Q0UGU1_9ARCH|nr:hypothetical protein [Candidatus Nanohalobium constans]QGA80796.1 hypothetical protein LC1Nh_0914 [Candidatus Nanohalobium constans]